MTPKEAFERALKAQTPKQPTWAERFAVKRRAIDRAILAEAERQIGLEAPTLPAEAPISFSPPPDRPKSQRPSRAAPEPSMREAIARMFGRPLT